MRQTGCETSLINQEIKITAINALPDTGALPRRLAGWLAALLLLAQVIQKGGNPANVSLYCSAASYPKGPILGQAGMLNAVMADGGTYETNFWEVIPLTAHDPFYPALVIPLSVGRPERRNRSSRTGAWRCRTWRIFTSVPTEG